MKEYNIPPQYMPVLKISQNLMNTIQSYKMLKGNFNTDSILKATQNDANDMLNSFLDNLYKAQIESDRILNEATRTVVGNKAIIDGHDIGRIFDRMLIEAVKERGLVDQIIYEKHIEQEQRRV